MSETWAIFDTRTDRQIGVFTCGTQEYAEGQIAAWRGGRQDIHDLMLHMEARRL